MLKLYVTWELTLKGYLKLVLGARELDDYRKCRRCGAIVSGSELVETESGHKACPYCGSTVLNVISIRSFRRKLAGRRSIEEAPEREEEKPVRRPIRKKSKYLLE